MSLPQQKPGTEEKKKLTELEYWKMQVHFMKKSITAMQGTMRSKDAEIAKLKQNLCDLNKQILIIQEAECTKQKDEFDKASVSLDNDYEQGLRLDIKKRLDIPLDKGFSYDPNTLEVKVTDK